MVEYFRSFITRHDGSNKLVNVHKVIEIIDIPEQYDDLPFRVTYRIEDYSLPISAEFNSEEERDAWLLELDNKISGQW